METQPVRTGGWLHISFTCHDSRLFRFIPDGTQADWLLLADGVHADLPSLDRRL